MERNINSPAFSTYSLAYTGGVSSASTETLQSLPTSPAPSDICSNFDEDDDSYSLIVSPTGKKRLKTSSISYHNLTDHVCRYNGNKLLYMYHQWYVLGIQKLFVIWCLGQTSNQLL